MAVTVGGDRQRVDTIKLGDSRQASSSRSWTATSDPFLSAVGPEFSPDSRRSRDQCDSASMHASFDASDPTVA